MTLLPKQSAIFSVMDPLLVPGNTLAKFRPSTGLTRVPVENAGGLECGTPKNVPVNWLGSNLSYKSRIA